MNLLEAKNRLGIYGLWELLGLPGEPGSSCLSPFRHERQPSFSVYAGGLRYYDFAEGKGGDAIDFLARAREVSNTAAFTEFIELATNPELPIRPVDFDGEALTCERRRRTEATPDKSLARIGNLPQLFKDFDTPYRRSYRDRLAKLRNVRPEAVELACQRGLLAFCHEKVPGYSMVTEWVPESLEPAWVITDNTRYNAQLRFLDGSCWDHLNGQSKAKTWPGSSARWPVGVKEAIPFPLIVLVEGGPDLLAAFHFAQLAGLEDKIGVVAMLGAGMSVHEEALPLFVGKHVRIIPDADAPGQMAADRWAAQLNAAGAGVDTVNLEGLRMASGTFVKDLNDCCLIHPDDAAQLEGLFEQ